jgi:uncharacterized protein YkwD
MDKRRSGVGLSLALGLLLLSPPSAVSFCDEPGRRSARAEITALDARVLELVNAERAKNGLPRLNLDPTLCQAARWLAEDMARRDCFSHTDGLGRTVAERLRALGYRYRSAGENIARGQATADEVVKGWLRSTGHRSNILSPEFREVGLAAVADVSGSRGIHWVQVFGARQ